MEYVSRSHDGYFKNIKGLSYHFPILIVSKISRNENVILLEQCLDHGDGAGWGVLT